MKLTNKHNAPEIFVNLAGKNYYNRGDSHYTITELIDAPRVRLLRRKHEAEMEQDVSDMLWQLMGSSMHVVMERAALTNHVVEQRVFTTIGESKISGQIDLQTLTGNGRIIEDYKFTSAWAVMNEKPEWEYQLNSYAWLVDKERVEKGQPMLVQGLKINAIVRDWSRHEATKENYPKTPIQVIDIPLWSYVDRDKFIRDRYSAHLIAEIEHATTGTLPECSSNEMWERPAKYAVTKEGNKRATRVFDTRTDAESYLSTGQLGQALRKMFRIDVRPAERVRCANNYCRVAQFCDQWKKYQADNALTEENVEKTINETT